MKLYNPWIIISTKNNNWYHSCDQVKEKYKRRWTIQIKLIKNHKNSTCVNIKNGNM